MTTIIIGAGASGLACAIRLKQNNLSNEVVVLERLAQTGKKILATGNGRCNLSNINADGCDKVLEFFSSLGLVTRADSEGRIYPYSNQAADVVEILSEKCSELGVKIINECSVNSIDKSLKVSSDKGIFFADSVVIACGGKAQKSLGSNGSGYALLRMLGHTITPTYPSLVQLTSSSKYPRALKGHRVKCSMSVLLDNECMAAEYGEVLFTDYGLSGIVTMNLSHIVSRNFLSGNPKKCHTVLDLIPDMSENEVLEHLKRFKNLNGILGKRMSDIITKQSDGELTKMAKLAKNWKLIITGTKGYEFAQITGGGADVNEFDNYKSKLVKGVYACGEVLDKQFECGGYNLNYAFLSGIEVADSIC